jgi:hypothetical protein
MLRCDLFRLAGKRMIFNSSSQRVDAKKVFSLLCLAIFLSLQALVTCPALHKWLHHDADKADHDCAVTMLAHGNLHLGSSTPVVVSPAPSVIEKVLEPISLVLRVNYRLLPGRAPPSVLA